jgi:hypothetical protein
MAKQQRPVRIEQRSQLAAMQQMEGRSDEELEAETKFKAAAQAILGARAAERDDAKAARAHFPRALRSDSSCAGWPTPRSPWPSAGPMTSSAPPSDSALRRRPAGNSEG